ncbi:MAG: glycosyltransferase family 4 protein [Gammaproteobacteria bacterium]|nr:glycosyltransferase family 4 protein [Gammaproteobacteria bacterium]MCD8542051.1 glycosyltransferase family 4 protein [Gammaproteobacteria bacterium]
MQITYNLNCLRQPLTGVAYYTINMVMHMLEFYPDVDMFGFRDNVLLSREAMMRLFMTLHETSVPKARWKKKIVEYANQSYWVRSLAQIQKNMSHSIALKQSIKNTIYHEPNFVFLPHIGKRVLTVHDTSMFDCPQFLPRGRAKFLQKQMKHSIHLSDDLIVSCHFIKKQLIDLTHVDAHRVHVIAPSVQGIFRPKTREETYGTLQKFSLQHKKFILCVATLEPRKNLIRLIKAYQQLSHEIQKEYPLVLVGSQGWMYEDLLKKVNQYRDSHILLLRYVEETSLLDLYASAKVFVYPSMYEGFGLPVLEAMQSGLPVIASNTTSLPDVVGDAGLLIDPIDEGSIALAIQHMLTLMPEDYEKLVQRSLSRAQEFSWKTFSEKLYAVYQGLLS